MTDDDPVFKPLGKYCWMPSGHPDSKLLKSVHLAFCSHKDRKAPEHKCLGVITLSQQAIILRCTVCGDVKAKLTEDKNHDTDL